MATPAESNEPQPKTTGMARAISPGPGGAQVMAEDSRASTADKPLTYHASQITLIGDPRRLTTKLSGPARQE
jgi:hypothetical protein